MSRFETGQIRAIRMALARQSYRTHKFRLQARDLSGFSWLVTTHRGLFAVSPGRVELVAHGWFFGICRDANSVYVFENCGMRDREAKLGRIVRLTCSGSRLSDPMVLVSGLHGNCHQLRVVDSALCLVDTANQRILRFDLDGRELNVCTPFSVAPSTDTTGAYLHMNGLAEVDGQVVLMLHNGKAQGPRKSEIVHLEADWSVGRRTSIDGFKCHDIVVDPAGTMWHCASDTGELINDKGERLRVSNTLMTRGLSIDQEYLVVGLSSFGERQVRDALAGEVVILDRQLREVARHELPAGPADIAALL